LIFFPHDPLLGIRQTTITVFQNSSSVVANEQPQPPQTHTGLFGTFQNALSSFSSSDANKQNNELQQQQQNLQTTTTTPTQTITGAGSKFQWPIRLPFSAILRFEKIDRQNSSFVFGSQNSYSFEIYTKDFRPVLRFSLDPSIHNRKVKKKKFVEKSCFDRIFLFL